MKPQVIKKKSDDYFEEIDCPVCGGREHKHYFRVKYERLKQKRNLDYSIIGINQDTQFYVKRCCDCGLVFVNPRLKPTYEAKIYNECKRNMYREIPRDNEINTRIKDRNNKLKYISPFLQTLAHVNLNEPDLKLFDFGCGFGYCMGIAREFGIDAYGVDIDNERLSICKQKGLKVAHPNEFDQKYPGIKADIILWMSNIEHLINLHEAAAFIQSKSKSGAVLYVNGLTPRIISIEKRRQEFIKAHFIEHINFFPIKTIDYFMAQYGFQQLTKPYMSIIKSTRDICKSMLSFIAGKTLGYNPLDGVFVRLYRYSN